MEKSIKKLGYGVAVHYNEFQNKFEVYRIGTYSPGTLPDESSKLISNKDLDIAINEYIRKYMTKNVNNHQKTYFMI